jgi:hypothetical protein
MNAMTSATTAHHQLAELTEELARILQEARYDVSSHNAHLCAANDSMIMAALAFTSGTKPCK